KKWRSSTASPTTRSPIRSARPGVASSTVSKWGARSTGVFGSNVLACVDIGNKLVNGGNRFEVDILEADLVLILQRHQHAGEVERVEVGSEQWLIVIGQVRAFRPADVIDGIDHRSLCFAHWFSSYVDSCLLANGGNHERATGFRPLQAVVAPSRRRKG